MEYAGDFNDLEPSYADLPMEIIVQIFRYLNFCDIQSASMTCHRWLEASEFFEFQSKVVLKISKVCISEKLPPGKIFMKSFRPFPNLYLDETVFGGLENFFAHLGRTTQAITFDWVDIGDKQFCAIIQDMPGISDLTITNCSSLFMAGQFLESASDRESIADTMCNVRRLSLKANQYLSDAILLRLTGLMANLETLDMSECHISFHGAIQRRFYPEESSAAHPSESILTFKFLHDVIKTHTRTLRELNLSQTLIGGSALTALAETNGLSLQKVSLSSCRQLNPAGLNAFIQSQTGLAFLDVSQCVGVTDACVDVIAEYLPSLETLNVKGCVKLTNASAVRIANMKRLKYLNISHCLGITSVGILEGIGRTKNETLLELSMSYLDLCEGAIVACAENLPNLRVFDVGNCVNGVTDFSVQAIIKNLRWLRDLSCENCVTLTDASITGLDINSKVNSNSCSTNSMEFFHSAQPSSNSENIKISLRSKAEEEIVQDAERKRAMIAMYEMNLVDDFTQDGVCIQQLKGLQSINLQGCNKITDVSLKYGLRFLELRRLLLSNCQQISLTGMEALVENCPSIEELDLSDCYNINDKTIEVISINLKRLKTLHLSGCTQLTDHSLDSIAVHCKVLQTLSVYRCRRMCSDIDLRLSSVSSLRTINVDRSSNLETADIFRIKKRLDY